MGWLRRILGGGGEAEDEDEEPDTAAEDDRDPAQRIDAARERLREEIPPLADDDEN